MYKCMLIYILFLYYSTILIGNKGGKEKYNVVDDKTKETTENAHGLANRN